MKKTSLYIAFAGILALCACAKETMSVIPDSGKTQSGISITGTYAQYDNSKTTLLPDGQSVRWGNPNDSSEVILVTYEFKSKLTQIDSCYHIKLRASLQEHSADHKTAHFSAIEPWKSDIRQISPGNRFIALYPYCATGGHKNLYPTSSEMQITFPSLQKAVKDGIPENLAPYSGMETYGNSANVMTAYATMDEGQNVNFKFKNVGALLKLTLGGDEEYLALLDRIRFKAKGSKTVSISGRPKGLVGNDGVFTLSGSFNSRKDTVTLAAPDAGWAQGTYYAVVLPTEGTKTAQLSIDFIYKDGTVVTKSNGAPAQAIVRNQIYNLPAIDVPSPYNYPTHKYQLYFNGTDTDKGPETGMWSLVDGVTSATNLYFSLAQPYTKGNGNDQPKFSENYYGCYTGDKRNSYFRIPSSLGVYKSGQTEKVDGVTYDKVNYGYKLVVNTSRTCYVQFTTSELVKSTATIYHVRAREAQTSAKICLEGVDNQGAVQDYVEFDTSWTDYTASTYTLKKGLKYTLKNASPAEGSVKAGAMEVALLSLTVQESN